MTEDKKKMRRAVFPIIVAVLMTGCSKPSATVMFQKATELQGSEQYDGAIEQFHELIKTYPDSLVTPEAVYALGTIYHDRKKDNYRALQYYRLLVAKYPDHATTSNAAFLIGFIYNNDIRNIDSAKIAYTEFLRKYPASPLAESAQFELSTMGKTPEEILKMQSQFSHGDKDADQE